MTKRRAEQWCSRATRHLRMKTTVKWVRDAWEDTATIFTFLRMRSTTDEDGTTTTTTTRVNDLLDEGRVPEGAFSHSARTARAQRQLLR